VRRPLGLGLVVLVLVAGAGVAAFVVLADNAPSGPPCTVEVDGHTYGIDRAQAANAQTITQAAASLGLPHHAVTVALAAATRLVCVLTSFGLIAVLHYWAATLRRRPRPDNDDEHNTP
jgi:hypothetical protein